MLVYEGFLSPFMHTLEKFSNRTRQLAVHHASVIIPSYIVKLRQHHKITNARSKYLFNDAIFYWATTKCEFKKVGKFSP
jgi:hypothetical protein